MDQATVLSGVPSFLRAANCCVWPTPRVTLLGLISKSDTGHLRKRETDRPRIFSPPEESIRVNADSIAQAAPGDPHWLSFCSPRLPACDLSSPSRSPRPSP